MRDFTLMEELIIFSIIALYIAFTGWLTIRLRSKTSEQFMVASRAMPASIIGILLMSEFIGAKSTVGTAQEAFGFGMAAAWSVIGASIGFLAFALIFVRKLYNTGEYTISGALAQKFGRSTMLTVSAIMIYALILVNVGNYISGAAAFATIMKIDLFWGTLIIAAVSTFYFAFGGLKGVAYVTILHSGVKIFGIIAIVCVAWGLTGGPTPMVEQMPKFYFTWDGNVGFTKIFAWVIGTVGAIFSTQFIVQAISSNKTANDARRSCFYAFFLCFPIGLALAYIGVSAKFLYPDMNSVYALPIFLKVMNPVMAGLVTTSLVASVFVSVSTVALAIASLMVRDFYVPMFNPTPEREMKMTRIFSLIIGFVPLFFVFLFPQILTLSFFTRALRLSVSVVALMAFYLPYFRSSVGANTAIISAAVITSVWFFLDNPYGIDNMYVALLVPAIVLIGEKIINPRGGPGKMKVADVPVKAATSKA